MTPQVLYSLSVVNYNFMGLFKESLQAIFVHETNPNPPAVTIASSEILFLLVSSLFYAGAKKGDSGIISLKKNCLR